jgi:hypothetical protein
MYLPALTLAQATYISHLASVLETIGQYTDEAYSDRWYWLVPRIIKFPVEVGI